MKWPNWLYSERRAHLAGVLHTSALGELAVVALADFQRHQYSSFGVAFGIFALLEILGVLLIPRKEK